MSLLDSVIQFFRMAASPDKPISPPVNWPTAGPAIDEHPPVPVSAVLAANNGQFMDGWWTLARKVPAHPRRVGGAISARGAVVHSTDCMPGTMAGIVKRWSTEAGAGNGANFYIGRRPMWVNERGESMDGVVQLVPITRNGNHAGGSNGHGWLKTTSGALIHPNTFYVGIEVDNAGRLVLKNGKWLHKDSGGTIPSADVFVDGRNKSVGWHRYTTYQFEALGKLLDALELVMQPPPDGLTLVPNGQYASNGVPWAGNWATAGGRQMIRYVGHVTLDPLNKTDPGPEMTSWLRGRYGLATAP